MLAQQKADEVTAQKGWAVKIVTHTTALPQIEQSLQGWTAQGSNTVVFYVLARQSGGVPVIAVTDDLESALPLSVRQHIAQRIMLPWYMNADYSTCLREGMEALLSDQLVLESVAFEGSYPINGVEEPQWQLSASSDAEDGVLAGAVCYKRQDVMELRPTFSFTGALQGSSIKIKATANDATYTVDGAVYNESTIQPSGPGIEISTGESVDYWADFEVEWSLSFDGGGSWVEMQKTENEVYITWGEPLLGPNEEFLYSEMLYYGCTQGKGQSGINSTQLINSLWSIFEARNLNITHFNPNLASSWLTYYNGPNPENDSHEIVVNQGAQGYDGECGAFESVFLRILLHQGFAAERVTLIPENLNETFLVNDWIFPDNETFENGAYPYVNVIGDVPVVTQTTLEGDEYREPQIRDVEHKYLWLESPSPDVIDDPTGLPGQGVQNPYSDFGKHYVVGLNGDIFDPSYGKRFESVSAWESESVSAFYKFVEAENEDKFYMYIRKNTDSDEISDEIQY